MNKHVVVIGAGIVGTSSAWHLQRKGLRVTLIDHVLPGQSCSFGNASCLATSSVVPFSYPGMIKKVPGWMLDPLGPVRIRPRVFPSLLPWFWRFWLVSNMRKVEEISTAQASLMHLVLADYDEILQATGSSHLKRSQGAIHIWDNEKQFRDDHWQIDISIRLGFSSQRLAPDELKSMVPGLALDGGVATLEPDWHQLLDPARVTMRIAEDGFADGIAWVQDRVESVESTGMGLVLQTASGSRIEADQLVVAAGAWSNTIAKQLDYKVPLIGKRGYHSQLSDPGVELQYPVQSMSRHFVMTPLEGGLRLAGTAEFAGLDAEPDYRRAKVLLKQASHYLPALKTEGATEWMGHRPMMADSLPVISASPKHPNVFYAFGHGHYGITQGPTTGRLIADLVAGDQPPVDLTAFRFDRFV